MVTLAAAVDIDGNGLLDDLVTLESPPGTVLHDVTAVPVPTDPAPPEGLVFPAGLFDYMVDVVSPGDPAEVTFHLPDGVVGPDAELGFWVLQDGEWNDLTPSVEVETVSDQVTGELVDGGAGDADGIADGVIDDPSGPAIVLAATDSIITARVWGDRLGNGSNQPLPGIAMSLWRDDGDDRFEPRGADVIVAGCNTGADGTCSFPGLAAGRYWVQQVAAPGDTWFAIQTWAPGDSSRANPSVAYAAYRYRDPAGGGPISVDGNNAKTTDWFAARRSNPDISEISCQQLMRIVLVLDRSGSIQSNNPSFYRNAVTGFVQDLVGTNTEIAVVSFAESASTDLGYQSVLGGNIDPILNAINSVYNRLGGGTNWDLGLLRGRWLQLQPRPRPHGHGRQPHPQPQQRRRQPSQLGRLHGSRDVSQPHQERWRLRPDVARSSPWRPAPPAPSRSTASSASPDGSPTRSTPWTTTMSSAPRMSSPRGSVRSRSRAAAPRSR